MVYGRYSDSSWTTTVVSPADSIDSWAPRVTVASDGTVHLVYEDSGDIAAGEGTGSRLFHIFKEPEGAWSERSEVMPERRTYARNATTLATGDTLYVAVRSGDHASGSDGMGQGWFRRGAVMTEDGVPSGQNVTWDGGTYFLDGDFYIPSNASLTIEAGTVVSAAASYDRLEDGDPNLVEFVVDGALYVEGTAAKPVVFTSTTRSPGVWGGIKFGNSAATDSRLDHATIEFAVEGITLDRPTVEIDSCTFANNAQFDILLLRDTTIPSYMTWDLVGPTRVGAVKNGTSDLELVVQGQLLARGASDATRVVFTSAEASPDSGDWYGVRFEDAADSRLSDLEYCDFEYPRFAVTLDSLSGNLFQCNFTHSDSADVHVVKDVRIPWGSEWSLLAPTTVVVDTLDPSGTRGLDPHRNEIIVYGALRTSRPSGAAATDSVEFRSFTGEPANDDWYGIRFEYCAFGSEAELRAAKIGYCTNPVTVVAPESALIEDSILHTYRDAGASFLWTDNFAKPVVSGSTFDGSRGASVVDEGAPVGIYSYLSTPALEDNRVLWHKEHGILVEYSKSYCNSSISYVDTLIVDGNTILGNGEGNGDFDEGWGLEVLWACEERPTRVSNNEVLYWPEGGVDLTACAGVRMHCNQIDSSTVGLQYSRGSQWSTEKVLLRQNLFTANASTNLWADDFGYIKLYQSASGWAKENMFQPDSIPLADKPRPNIYNAAPNGILNARYTMWMNGYGDILPESDSSYVRSLIDGNDSTAVNIKNFLADFEYCTGSSSAQQARGEEAVDGELLASTAASGLGTEAVPDRWDVVARRTPGAALVRLAVPAGVEGPVRVAIYDVRGRRVAIPFERGTATPGWYDLQWRQVDSSGRRVASGVYFLRVEADGVALSRKVVVIQ